MTQIRTSPLELRTVMVDTQVRPSDVTKFPIIDALLSVPREAYVPDALASVAYADAPVSVGAGRELMEARTFAKMLDALDLERAEMALVVGCGRGYSAAVLGHMLDGVVAVEEDADLAREAEAALGAQGVHNVAVMEGALTAGAPKAGPYDVVLLDGGIQEVPAALADQLKEGGRIVAIFMEGALGEVRLGVKSNGRISWRTVFNATVPVLPGFARDVGFAL